MDSELIHQRRWWTLSVLCLSLLMVIIGNTVLNVAIPTLTKTLGATQTQLEWIVDAYGLVFAGLLLTAGALGDRYGRKGALTVGLVIFGSGSAFAAVSHSAGGVIAARAIMGLGAALVMPSTLSILTNVFPPHERGRAIGIWAGLAGAGAAIGPITSGWLLEHFWWGSVFLINLPVVALALVSGRFLVPTSRDEHHERLDPIGALLSILGLGVLLYGLIEAPNKGWVSTPTLGSFAAAAVILGLFGWWELRNPHPMLDLAFFKNPRFSAACGAITFVFFAMFGLFFLFTQYLQLVKGYNPLQAGVRTLPMALTMMVVAPSSARLVERTSPRAVVTTGLATVAFGLVLMSRAGVSTGYPYIALVLVVLATGMGLTMAPSTGSIMSSIPMSKAGVGSAMNDTTRELGGALGVAVLGSLLASRYDTRIKPVVHALPANLRRAAAESLGNAIGISHSLPAKLGEAVSLGARDAFAHAMGTSLLVGAGVALVAAGFVNRYLPAEQSFARPGPAPTSNGATPPATAAATDGESVAEATLNAAKAASLEP